MFELERAIDEWKRKLASRGSITPENLDELEDHLRSEITDRVDAGQNPARAFTQATDRLGSVEELTREFDKVEPETGRGFLWTGWGVYVLSFFLPVYRWGALWVHDSVRGWEAFLMALDPEIGLYGIASGLTNWLMIATFFPRFRRRRAWPRLMLGAGLLNTVWLALIDPIRDLQVGYYAWWASFLLVGAGLWAAHRARARRTMLGETTA